jgi:predicted transcriptional regulator
MEDLDKKIIELMDLFDDEVVTTADKMGRPEEALRREMFQNAFKSDRTEKAGGGMLVQPSADGSRPGYAKITEKGKSTPKGGRPIPENIVMADDTKAIKELQNKVDKLNRVNKLDDKGIKFKVIKTQAGNYTTELSYLAKDYREKLGKQRTTGKLTDLIEEFNQFKKTDLFKNYSKSATMKAGGVKSAKKQLADIGSKKLEVFDYLLNNKNATIEQIAKDLKIKDGVVRTSLQGLYTDIYKRTADQGAVYLKDFNSGQLESVHGSIKNTKVRLKDRVKNLVIDAYKGDKNLKPLLEKLDNFYTLQNEIKKTPYGKFFAANLDHPVPLNFIRQLEEGADPFNLIRVRPIPEFLNQRAFKAQFDRVLGTAYKTGNKKALEAIVNLQSYLPQEFGGITKTGKIIDYGAKPFSLKTDLTQSNFGDIYKRVFEFIKNPELQETFKESKVSFKNLASQEKNIMNQVKGLKAFMKKQGIPCFVKRANGGPVTCDMPQAYEKSLNQISKAAQAGDSAAQSKLLNFRKAVGGAGSVIKGVLGPAAIAAEIGIAIPIGLFEYAQGKPKEEIINTLTYGLAGKSREDKLKEEMPTYGQGDALQSAFDGYLSTLNKLGEERDPNQLRPGKKADDMLKTFYERQEPFMRVNPQVEQGQMFDLDMFRKNVAESDALRKKFTEEDLKRKQERRTPFDLSDPFMAAKGGRAGFMAGTIPGGYGKEANRYLKEIETDMHRGYQYYKRSGGKKSFRDYMRESMSRYFAGGGIAKEAGDPSGPPPESGPNSQGLQGLLNRVKKT